MKRTSTWIIVTLSLVTIALLVWIAYLVWNPGVNRGTKVTSFDTCADAGNPVMESYPRQCRDPKTGVLYVESVSSASPDTLTTRSYTSLKGVTIELDNWSDTKQVVSPLIITGRVPGSWSFEASFPIMLKDSTGVVIAQVPATLQGDWMTDDMVPFTATLEFTKPAGSMTGSIILEKSNPSDLAQNADSLTLPLNYK